LPEETPKAVLTSSGRDCSNPVAADDGKGGGNTAFPPCFERFVRPMTGA
jgi:hypothetical protein